MKTLVSIQCLVYNHEPYLQQCLEGFVMQKTTFAFEAIVHDDASTDGSAAIIREYAEKYPNIIKPIIETENQYSKHDGTLDRIMNEATSPSSKYIAFCEGDDYWIDPLKLQKQVNFLESHPEYVICSHDYICYDQNKMKLNEYSTYSFLFNSIVNKKEYLEYTLVNYFNGWWTHPLTCVYRNGLYLKEIPREKYKYFRDDVFFYYVLKNGKGALMHDVMGVYRVHDNGAWSKLSFIDRNESSMFNAYNIYLVEKDKRAFNKILHIQYEVLSYLRESGQWTYALRKVIKYFNMDPYPFFFKLLKRLFVYDLRNHKKH